MGIIGVPTHARMLTDLGYVSWIGTYATRDAVLVHILKELGAVPFVKTNIPQTLMVCHQV